MTKVTNQIWNFDLDAAKGKGYVILAGVNKNDNTKWVNEAALTDEGWVLANTFEVMNFDNSIPKAWAELNLPF